MYNLPTILRQHNVITEARYDMGVLEKNILYLLMSQISKDDEPEKLYEVSVMKLKKKTGDFSIEELRKATTNLLVRNYHIQETEDRLLVVSLMSVVAYSSEDNLLKIKISKKYTSLFRCSQERLY